ncbi:hypothetical protein [Conexibacter sp. DBS9H8]|uniref:hypothetical protein n=1 Tax=Conexibacter sp. DBS9H8 TaxID=2937801 RepID=UPI00200FB815|nr:hypothetical protein [Conexibacter sp. DBS9H8]
MSGRSENPRPGGGEENPRPPRSCGRQMVGPIHWRVNSPERDWVSAHRAARIQARCDAARARHLRYLQGRGRCGH